MRSKKGDFMKYLLHIMLCSSLFTSIYGVEKKKTDACERTSCPEVINRRLPSNRTCDVRCSRQCFDCGTTIFLPRSQGANTARELAAWQKQLHTPYLVENYVALAATTEYTRSFKECQLAQRLFCTDCLTFSGSKAANRRNGQEIVADYFGLPNDFRGTLSIKPFIENYIVDLNMYFGLSEWLSGLYLRVHMPITHTRWSLGLDECLPCADKFRGSNTFPDCYMFSNTAPKEPTFTPGNVTCAIENAVNPLQLLNRSPLQFTNNNCTTQSIREALSGDFTFGDMQEKWNFGRFDFCPRKKTGLADVDIILGLNFFQSDFGHFGLFAQLVVPTGNKPKSKFIFEPLLGNGRHLELGGGISMHWSLYSDYCPGGRNLSFYIEGNVTHLFTNDQIRSFDFTTNGLLSRYILLKEFGIDNTYLGRTINAINFTTRNADVSIRYKIDFSTKLAFTLGGWNIDLGYNIYARDRECVCIKTECPCDIDQRRFGIKGTEGVCCKNFMVMDGMVMPIPPNENVPTNLIHATQPNATMFTSVLPTSGPVPPATAEEVCLGYNSKDIGQQMIPLTDLTPENGFIIARDEPVQIISCRDLDPSSAAQCSILTHKVFGHWGYIWYNSCYTPHLGIGAEFEFNGKKPESGLNQWGVWLKGGITF